MQHAPLEPRTAVAEWADGKLTVWTATQNPFGVRGELAQAFRLADEEVRVIVPDFGSGYGGKHTGECAVEAARLAKAAGKPVMLRWTREEEFTWAYFRPAAVIDMEASLDDENRLATWWHVNINSGGNSIESPYDVPRKRVATIGSRPPLRHGSYRALASTANSFARESFMDELAAAAGADPLEFRLAHLNEPRLRPVLEEAAKRFNWAERVNNKQPNRGVGLACSLDKGSFVACCAEVEVDRRRNDIRVLHVCEAFDCGPVMNPDNLRNQIEGAIIMGLGPALREEMQFADGEITNAIVPAATACRTSRTCRRSKRYAMNRKDVEAAGAGETPIIVDRPGDRQRGVSSNWRSAFADADEADDKAGDHSASRLIDCVPSRNDASKPFDDLRAILKFSAVDVNPANPVATGENRTGCFESENCAIRSSSDKRTASVRVKARLPAAPLVANEAAEQPRDVRRGCVDVDGAEIDDASYVVALEKNVVVPHIADARLKWQGDVGERFELVNGWWDAAR